MISIILTGQSVTEKYHQFDHPMKLLHVIQFTKKWMMLSIITFEKILF